MGTAMLRSSLVGAAALSLFGAPALAAERSAVEECLYDPDNGQILNQPCLISEAGEPVSGDGIEPELWHAGNLTCDDIGFGDVLGFKIDATPAEGTYPFTSDYGVLDGGPEDPDNSVTISNLVWVGDNIVEFDWASTLPVYAVIVKAQDANVYVYVPPDTGDTGLGTPFDTNQISHVEFCYDYALIVSKTAQTSFVREYTWTIDKSAESTGLSGFIGGLVGTDYDVIVDRSVEDHTFLVEGEIQITNPTATAVGITVEDVLEGGYTALVDCPDQVGALETVTCGYVVEVDDGATRLNTVTVTTDNPDVAGNVAEALAVFDTEPTTTLGQPAVTVTDDLPTDDPWGPVSGYTAWTYGTAFACPTDPALYVGGLYTFQVDNTAEIVETGQTDTETVLIDCYAPIVTKDAIPEFTRTFTWDIDKRVDPSSHVGFAGDTFGSEYALDIARTTTDSDFAVVGTIAVVNPHPTESMTVALSDTVGDVPATLYCVTPLVVPPGGTATCGYSAALGARFDGTNTATATFDGIAFGGTATWAFGEPTTVVGAFEVVVTDTNLPGTSVTVSDDQNTVTYGRELQCPSDAGLYVGGVYGFAVDNTATITETGQSASASVSVTCYAPIVTKDAFTRFTRYYEWTIDKSVTPSAFVGFVGEGFEPLYGVAVERTERDADFVVFGTITLTNPHPSASMTVALYDEVDGVPATLDCGGNLVVPPGGSGTCGYTAYVGAPASGTNTATADLNGAIFTGTAPYAFGTEPFDYDGPGSVTVTDTNGGSWAFVDDGMVSYTMPLSCSRDPAHYVSGTYSFQVDNIATITQTGQYDAETVTVTCYAPVVTKDAHTAYLRTYTWDITKHVDPTAHVGFPGDAFQSDYVVTVQRTDTDSDFRVYGGIWVGNPNPEQPMTVTLSDRVGDVPATVDCGGGTDSLTIAAGQNGACTYEAALGGPVDGTNTATATLGGVGFTGTSPWAFGDPTDEYGFEEVGVTDDMQGVLGYTEGGSGEFAYAVGFYCPTEYSVYAATGRYDETRLNTATIVETGQYADAQVDLTCYDPAQSKVIKTTEEGPEAIGQVPFAFGLYAPDGTYVETAYLDGAGEVVFTAALETQGLWTVEEIVPAGWVDPEPGSCTFEVAYPADAGVTHACTFHNVEKGRVEVVKFENGQPAEGEWVFALYLGPEGFGTEPVETVTVPYEPFTADLDPFEAWTLCELGLPAGWYAEWTIDTDGDGYGDTLVTPYNPSVGEDLGHRCFEFGAGTAYAVPVGDTLVFEVDNAYGEGGPRTPGYWKNWSTCSSGNQAETALRNGGWAEGYWLLDDVLPVYWDDMLADEFVFAIDTCDDAVAVLGMRDARRGTVHASDPAYKLARNLLAFQANVAAGACLPDEPVFDGVAWQTIQDVAVEAELLLDEYDFDGMGSYFRIRETAFVKKVDPKTADAIRALQLAATLDLYNNGTYCFGPE